MPFRNMEYVSNAVFCKLFRRIIHNFSRRVNFVKKLCQNVRKKWPKTVIFGRPWVPPFQHVSKFELKVEIPRAIRIFAVIENFIVIFWLV